MRPQLTSKMKWNSALFSNAEKKACATAQAEARVCTAQLNSTQEEKERASTTLSLSNVKLHAAQADFESACERLQTAQAKLETVGGQLKQAMHTTEVAEREKQLTQISLAEHKACLSDLVAQREQAELENASLKETGAAEQTAIALRMKEIEQAASTVSTKLRTHEAGITSLSNDFERLIAEEKQAVEVLALATAALVKSEQKLGAAKEKEEQLHRSIASETDRLRALKDSAAASTEAVAAASTKAAKACKAAATQATNKLAEKHKNIQDLVVQWNAVDPGHPAGISTTSLGELLQRLEEEARLLQESGFLQPVSGAQRVGTATAATRSSKRRPKEPPVIDATAAASDLHPQHLAQLVGDFHHITQTTSDALAGTARITSELRASTIAHSSEVAATLSTIRDEVCLLSNQAMNSGAESTPELGPVLRKTAASPRSLAETLILNLTELAMHLHEVCGSIESEEASTLAAHWKSLAAQLSSAAGSSSGPAELGLLEDCVLRTNQMCDVVKEQRRFQEKQRNTHERPVLQFLSELDPKTECDISVLVQRADSFVQAQR